MGFPGTDGATPGHQGPEGFEFDRALARFEDVLLGLPFDRALPDLDALLDSAGISPELLRRDDRILKVLHEAIVARPFGQLDEVLRTRTDVELCTLEVQVLTERLRVHADEPEMLERITMRLATLRARLDEVRRQL